MHISKRQRSSTIPRGWAVKNDLEATCSDVGVKINVVLRTEWY